MNLRSIWSVSILILIMILSAGCKRDDFSWGEKIGDITYSGNVVFLGAQELALINEVTSSKIIFSDKAGEIEKINNKSILVIGVSELTPYGSLRQVSSIQTTGTEIVINTTDALLTDAIKEGTIKLQKKLMEKDFRLKSKAEGVLVKGPDKSFDGLAVTLDNFKIFEDGTRIAYIDGSIGISPEIGIVMELKSNRLKEINIVTMLNKIDEVNVFSNGAFSGTKEEVAVEFIHSPIIIDGLVFVPEITINCGFDGTASSRISSGVRQDRIISSRIHYLNTIWSDDPLTHSEIFDFTRPQVTDNADLKIFSGPEITIKLFGVPVQTIKATGFFSLEAIRTGSPKWKLFIGSDGYNTVKADILGLNQDHLFDMAIQASEIGRANGK